MDLTQLEMLVATVEAGGVQKAAAKVFRTQPAVSMALRKLEQEIGGPLFDRSVRSAYVLTPEGRLLYECGDVYVFSPLQILRKRMQLVFSFLLLQAIRFCP